MFRKKDKYLFLDIDGVLNNLDTFKLYLKNELESDLDEENLINLKAITDKIDNLHIILSSSWRLYESDKERLKETMIKYGIPVFEDITPYLTRQEGHKRYDEILQWMKKHHVYKNQIVILDDIMDMGPLQNRLVLTDYASGGLTKEHVQQVFNKFHIH